MHLSTSVLVLPVGAIRALVEFYCSEFAHRALLASLVSCSSGFFTFRAVVTFGGARFYRLGVDQAWRASGLTLLVLELTRGALYAPHGPLVGSVFTTATWVGFFIATFANVASWTFLCGAIGVHVRASGDTIADSGSGALISPAVWARLTRGVSGGCSKGSRVTCLTRSVAAQTKLSRGANDLRGGS